MIFSYKTRRFLRGLAIFLLILVLVVVAVWLVWLLWLARFVVYTADGAHLDFSLSAEYLSGQVAAPPEEDMTVSIYYNDGSDAVDTSGALTQLNGYYIDSGTLMNNMTMVQETVGKLPAGTPVMLDVKSIYGYFFYSSSTGPTTDSIDIDAVDQLILDLRSRNIYMIARLPAFRDRYFGLNHDIYGLAHTSGRYLYEDGDGCYWMNPESSGAMSYIVQIINELKDLGFSEVVLTEFRFPDTDNIRFDGDRTETLNAAAASLITTCGSDTFAVSFQTEQGKLSPQAGRSRLFFQNVAAVNVQGVAEAAGVEDPLANLVFLTESNDSRYDDYSVLRPIMVAQEE